jgi:hypothetical protein
MLILPTTIATSENPIIRRHSPKRLHYGLYRACLRWEFGFTCAFCLLHEADLIARSEGTGLMTIEHLERQKTRIDLRDDYGNVVLACRFCNGARGKKPRHAREGGGSLLDPTLHAWATHFRAFEGRVAPLDGDADAAYTESVYDLNEPRKLVLRREHTAILGEALRAVKEGPDIVELLATELRETTDLSRRRRLVGGLRLVRQATQRAADVLRRFTAVPPDADIPCRCMASPTLPPHVAKQCLEVELPDA